MRATTTPSATCWAPGSPLGTALLGAKPGDTVSFEAPNGNTLRVEIRSVE